MRYTRFGNDGYSRGHYHRPPEIAEGERRHRGGHGHGGRGGGGGRRYFGRGGVRIALLRLLAREPMHGYQMMRLLEEESGGFYVPSPGSIYPTLQMLQDEGLVSLRDEDGKKVYSLTDAGREAALQMRDSGRPERREPRGGADDDADGCRHDGREWRLRRKLGLSEAGFEVLQGLMRAERQVEAAGGQNERLNQLLSDMQRLLDQYAADSGIHPDAAPGGEGEGD